VSGTTDEREGLTEALAAVRYNGADGVVAYSLDRLARSLTVQEAALQQVWQVGNPHQHPQGQPPRRAQLGGEILTEFVALFARIGGAHFQIGRRYSYADRLDPATRELLATVKQWVDPGNAMNPGALGIG
jgi:hypothetical protein